MKKVIKVLALLILALLLFSGCSADGSGVNSSNSLMPKNDANRQINVLNYTEQLGLVGNNYYFYSFTNGKKYLDRIYVLQSDSDNLVDANNLESLELNYYRKYEYSYLNGDPESSFKVKCYIRDDIDEEPWYHYMYSFGRDFDYREKLGVLHSYDIGTSGRTWDDLYYNYTYDESGKLIERSDAQNYDYFSYDSEGHLIIANFDSVPIYYTYSEDSSGNILSITKTTDGEVKSVYEYEYDENNRIISETEYVYSDNELKRTQEINTYSYDDEGNVSNLSVQAYDSDSEDYKTSTLNYYYDEDNNVSQIVEYEDDGDVEYRIFVYTQTPEGYTQVYG